MIAGLGTYSLSDFLMFSPEMYFRLYELYNAAIWPIQVGVAVLAPAVAWLGAGSRPWRGRLGAALLAAAWAAVAWGFFLRWYAEINLVAPWLAAGFLLQALLLAALGTLGGHLGFVGRGHPAGRVGLALLVYAALVHPLVGPLAGRSWTGVELFGLAPDPTVLGTLAVLAAARGTARWALAVIPLLWCLASGLTYVAMGVAHGLVTPALGLVAVLAMALRR